MKIRMSILAAGLLFIGVGTASALPPTLVVPPFPHPGYPVAPPAAPILGGPLAAPDNTPPGLKGCLNRHGLACVSHHSWFGCGNFRSEMTFIFGSCRTFFGQACVPIERGANGRRMGNHGGILGHLRGCSSCAQ